MIWKLLVNCLILSGQSDTLPICQPMNVTINQYGAQSVEIGRFRPFANRRNTRPSYYNEVNLQPKLIIDRSHLRKGLNFYTASSQRSPTTGNLFGINSALLAHTPKCTTAVQVQLGWGSNLNNPALVHYDHSVIIDNCAEPVWPGVRSEQSR
jgi:hypothetical protein